MDIYIYYSKRPEILANSELPTRRYISEWMPTAGTPQSLQWSRSTLGCREPMTVRRAEFEEFRNFDAAYVSLLPTESCPNPLISSETAEYLFRQILKRNHRKWFFSTRTFHESFHVFNWQLRKEFFSPSKTCSSSSCFLPRLAAGRILLKNLRVSKKTCRVSWRIFRVNFNPKRGQSTTESRRLFESVKFTVTTEKQRKHSVVGVRCELCRGMEKDSTWLAAFGRSRQ